MITVNFPFKNQMCVETKNLPHVKNMKLTVLTNKYPRKSQHDFLEIRLNGFTLNPDNFPLRGTWINVNFPLRRKLDLRLWTFPLRRIQFHNEHFTVKDE